MNATFIGFTHNSVDLAACGLAFVTMNIISVSMADGISDGMDVLVSKAFGRDDIESCEIYLNLCRYTILLFAIPQAIITIFLNHILILFGQNEEVAYRAWTMCLFTFPGVVMMNLFEWDRRYLTCCELVNPGMYISIGCIVLHGIMLYLSVVHFGYGVIGAGVSTLISYFVLFGGLELYCIFQKYRVHQLKWRLSANMVKYIPSYLENAIPCCLVLFISWLPQEILTIFAGMIGVHELAAMSILSSFYLFVSDIWLGIGISSSALVGNSLGENKPNQAKRFTYVSLMISVAFYLTLVWGLFICEDYFILLYTSDSIETSLIKSVFLIYLLDLLGDVLYEATGEILEILCFQYQLLISLIVWLWAIMLPLSYVAAFPLGYGFRGILVVSVGCSFEKNNWIFYIFDLSCKKIYQVIIKINMFINTCIKYCISKFSNLLNIINKCI